MNGIATSLILLLTVTGSSQAALKFYNSGTTNNTADFYGWERENVEHYGSITENTGNKYAGTTGLKFYQRFDSNYTGRYHCMEGTYELDAHLDQTRWVGFAFKTSSTWNFYTGSSFWIYQTIGYYPDLVSEEIPYGKKPNTWLTISGSKLIMGRQYGTLGDFSTAYKTVVDNLQPGTWYSVVIKTHFSDDNDGKIEVWVNGDGDPDAVMDGPNCFTGLDDEQWGWFGMYCTDWYGSTSRPVSSVFLYMDEFRIGDENSSYSEVAP